MKIIFTILCSLIGTVNFVNAQNITIPDSNFKSYLVNNPEINTNGDSEIQLIEAEAFIGTIDCNSRNIQSLSGIEKFKNITELICYSNSLFELNLFYNTKLKKLNCGASGIQFLEISQNIALTDLSCVNNGLTYLDVSNNFELKTLYTSNNQFLSELNVSNNPKLEVLYTSSTSLTSLDLTQNTLLKSLDIGFNQISNIDLSQNVTLMEFYCGLTQLSNLDVSKNIKLKILQVFDNPLITTLDVSKNVALLDFICPRNGITALDVSKNILMQKFYCHENSLTSLDVKTNINLVEFSCFGNQLTNLDVKNNTYLTLLSCRDNQLNSLNLKNGNNTLLSIFRATNNPSLECIEVDNVDFANFQSNWLKDDIASYNINCSLSVTENDKNNFKIYPNPVKNTLNFSQEVSNIYIIDTSGKIIKNFNNNSKLIDISNVSKGVYLITFTLKSGKTVSKKFIKD